MHNVMIKMSEFNIQLQHHAAKLGVTPSGAHNVQITDVPDDVSPQDIVELYRKTGIFHGLDSNFIVPYSELGEGKALVWGLDYRNSIK